MKPEVYEAWYRSPRGRWIGATEYALLREMLGAERGAALIDIGCGTGYFTRLFARDLAGSVVGIDPNLDWLRHARAQAHSGETYLGARAERLPFADRSFDYAVSVTALCFVREQQRALRELLRVTRKRFALGLLHRHSLLYWQKGRAGGKGAYAGAHWHSAAQLRALFASLPVRNLVLRSAIVLPQGGALARAVEPLWPASFRVGGFLAVAGEVA